MDERTEINNKRKHKKGNMFPVNCKQSNMIILINIWSRRNNSELWTGNSIPKKKQREQQNLWQ